MTKNLSEIALDINDVKFSEKFYEWILGTDEPHCIFIKCHRVIKLVSIHFRAIIQYLTIPETRAVMQIG